MTPQEYLNRARGLLPALRQRASYTEQLRRLPDETLKEFQEAGLFRALQPKRYGGYELDPGTFYQAVIDLGTVCGSSAWILGVVGVHNWQLALFHPQAQEDVWHEDSSRQISSSLAPTGDAANVTAWSVQATDRLFKASGGHAIFLNNPIQRAWRDVHAIQAHAANNPEKVAAIFGRSEFGLPNQELLF